MPTNRLHIKFSKTAFLHILKYAIKLMRPIEGHSLLVAFEIRLNTAT